VWVEWRPLSCLVKALEVPRPWARVEERPPRITSGGSDIMKGSFEIDVDLLAYHGDIVRPRPEIH